jgi:Flp pilus assembly protein CpaB
VAPGAVLESGTFMTPTALSEAAASAVAKSIPTGDVAVTVSIGSIVNRVAGFIRPGDQVDMLVQPSAGVWQFLYQNVNVLAVGPDYSAGNTTAQATNPAAVAADATAITFAVPAVAAARILAASSHGLYLALVPPGNVATAQPAINQDNLIPATVTP